MNRLGIKTALMKGGLLAMGVMIGTGSLFGIEIDDERTIGLEGLLGIRVALSSADLRVFASGAEGEAKFRLVGKSMQRLRLSLDAEEGWALARIERPWKVPALEKLRLEVYLPPGYGKDFDASLTSGRIAAQPLAYGALALRSTSGSIEIEGAAAREASIRSTSGKISIGRIECARASLKATSGAIAVDACLAAELEARASSGRISLSYPRFPGWKAAVEASSGSVLVELPADASFVPMVRSASGKIVSDFSEAAKGGTGAVWVKTSSGRIEVRKGGKEKQ